jgi:hypothetical protein
MLTHEELKKKMLNNFDVQKEYELLLDRLEDIELAKIVQEREGQPEVEVDINDLNV